MKNITRLLSLVLAAAMLLSVIPLSAAGSFAPEAEPAVQTLAETATPLRRPVPTMSISADAVTRVAYAQYSQVSGTTIVAATPSGVPELNSSYASQAYAGETPAWTKVTLTINGFDSAFDEYNPALLNTPIITCVNNSSVTLSAPVIDGNTYTWTVSGGTATAGTYLKFKVSSYFTWDNPYTYTRVTNNYDVFAYSYVENIIFPAGAYVWTTDGKSGSGDDEVADVRYVSRVLGRNTYGSIPSGDSSSRGYHNFAANSFVSTASDPMASSWYWSPSRSHTDSATYINGSTAVDANRSVATVYVDPSVDNISTLNLRMSFFQNEALRDGNNDSGTQYYRGIFVKSGAVTFDQNTTSDASAKTALGVRNTVTSDGLDTLTSAGDSTIEQFTGTTTANASYTLIPYFYTRNSKTGMFLSSKNNHTRVGTTLNIVSVNKGALRTAISNTAATGTSSGIDPTGTDSSLIKYYQTGFSGMGRGTLPQSWYYASSIDYAAYDTALDSAESYLVNPKSTDENVSYSSATLTQAYAALRLNSALSGTVYYGNGSVYDSDYSNVLPEIGTINTTYYSESNPNTALKPLDTLITAATSGTAYQIYYKNDVQTCNILQFWPNEKQMYSAESVAQLEQALANANQVKLDSYNILYQPTIDKAARELQTAIEGLEFAPLDVSSATAPLAQAAEVLASYSPVYNPIVSNPYSYTSMSGTLYETQLPDGKNLYTYKDSYRNNVTNATNAVKAFTNNPDNYSSLNQEDFDNSVLALVSLLNSPQYAIIVITYWSQVSALVTTELKALLTEEHNDYIDSIINESYNYLNSTTENQSTLNALADQLYLYLYNEPAEFTLIDAAINGAIHRNNRITAVNPAGGNRSELYYYSATTRNSLQTLIDTAESNRPVFDGDGNPTSVSIPVIDKATVVTTAENIATATDALAVAGADFKFVKDQIDVGVPCAGNHYLNWSAYETALLNAQTALNVSGANESNNWQATNISSKYRAANQAGSDGPDALALALYNARNALVHKTTTVTFDLNYGTDNILETQDGASGDDSVIKPTDPERFGYAFGGWFAESGCTTAVELPVAFPLVNTTYYAKWNANAYSITFDGNGSTGGNMTPQSIVFDASAAIKSNSYQKLGHEFAGWALSADGEIVYADKATFTMNIAGITLYAKWTIKTYYIIYYIDGVEYVRVPYTYGAPVTPYAEPSRSGYTFSGWAAHPATMPAGDLQIMGTFDPILYDVIYNVDDELYYTDHLASGTAFTTIPEPEKEGYEFSGWEGAPSVMPSYTVTINGYFDIKTYSLFYYVDGSIYYTARIKYNAVITPIAPSKTGYTFSGWSPALPARMPASSITVYGTYSPTVYNAYFKLDSDTDYVTVPTAYGSEIVLPDEPTKPGFSFNGWNSVPSTMPAGDITIMANWISTGYEVSFYVNNGLIHSTTLAEGEAIELPNYTPPEGYTFSGWSPDVPATMPAEAMSFYGTTSLKTVTLTFYVDGVIRNDLTVTANYGAVVTAPTVTKLNYTFSGWSPEVPALMPANDTAYYGTFTADTSTVTFNLNGGTGTVPEAVTDVIGAAVTLPAQGDIAREGYDFLGWNTDLAATVALESYAIDTTDAVLYAVWSEAVAIALVPEEDSTTVIDRTNGYIYGITEGLSKTSFTNNFLAVHGEGRVECLTSGNRVGTGTVVNFYNDKTNELIESFIVVVFGDLDGNGLVNSRDISAANSGLVEGFEEEYIRTAANISILRRNDTFNARDLALLVEASMNEGINQEEIAISRQYYGM